MTFTPAKSSMIPVAQDESALPYAKPTLTVMSEGEILAAFQMTAAKISAAGCWWGTCVCSSGRNE